MVPFPADPPKRLRGVPRSSERVPHYRYGPTLSAVPLLSKPLNQSPEPAVDALVWAQTALQGFNQCRMELRYALKFNISTDRYPRVLSSVQTASPQPETLTQGWECGVAAVPERRAACVHLFSTSPTRSGHQVQPATEHLQTFPR
ncbi:hypothetical protein MHYP_G00182780 [Metynnis hypsauchen]